jgi:three-Cys-motif partner protein
MPMATGADDRYWERQGLPSVFKHDLLTRYLPQFGGKTGSKARGVVYLDGYAGRGRYEDKTPGSAERIMQIAEQQGTVGIAYRLFFYESDQKSYAALQEVVDEYAARGLRAAASRDDVITGLPGVITAAEDKSLFLFLDPCGLGLPFADLTATLTGPRASKWPPTEILLNFSLYAVRRIAGHVFSPTPNEKTTGRLDTALGGTWWRDVIRKGGLTEDAVEQIVQEFVNRLSKATSMHIYAIPVRRAPHHKPVYYLVFGTRRELGIWYFADGVARATEKWWETLDAQETAKNENAPTLFNIPELLHPDIKEVEAEARPVIAENIARLAEERGTFQVGDFPDEVFGDYLGRVRETVVRAAIKHLHSSGRTPSDGKGSPISSLIVTRQSR